MISPRGGVRRIFCRPDGGLTIGGGDCHRGSVRLRLTSPLPKLHRPDGAKNRPHNEGGIADMPRHVPTLDSVIHPQKHLAQHEKIRLIREIRCSIPNS